MRDADRIAGIVNEWFQTLPTPAEQQRDRSGLIADLATEFERATLAERVRIVNEVRAFAEQVRGESLTGPITAGIIDQAADRINTLGGS